jgi:hypothetical protein
MLHILCRQFPPRVSTLTDARAPGSKAITTTLNGTQTKEQVLSFLLNDTKVRHVSSMLILH